MKTGWTLLQKAVCTLQHFQKQMSKHRKLLILMVIIKTGGHARDRFSLTFLPANAKPVVPVFCQAPHFPETGPKPTGSAFRTGMPSSGQKGPAGGRKKTPPFINLLWHHCSFSPMFTWLAFLSLSLCLSHLFPSTGKCPTAAAAAGPRSVWLGPFFWRFSTLSRCRLSSPSRQNGASLDSRVRPRTDSLHPNRCWQTNTSLFIYFLPPSCNAKPQKGSKEALVPPDKHMWVGITDE